MYKRNESRLIWESLNGNDPNALSPATKQSLQPLDIVTVNKGGQHDKFFILRIKNNVALCWPVENASAENADIFTFDELTPTGEKHTPTGWGGLK